MARTFDPIELEVLWQSLIATVNEQARALQRAAFSPIVREAGDLCRHRPGGDPDHRAGHVLCVGLDCGRRTLCPPHSNRGADTRSLRHKVNKRAEKEWDKEDVAFDARDKCQQSANVNAYWEPNTLRCLDRRTGRTVAP